MYKYLLNTSYTLPGNFANAGYWAVTKAGMCLFSWSVKSTGKRDRETLNYNSGNQAVKINKTASGGYELM